MHFSNVIICHAPQLPDSRHIELNEKRFSFYLFLSRVTELCDQRQYFSVGFSSFHVCSDKAAAPPEMPIVIDHVALKDILGPPLFEMEVSRNIRDPQPTITATCVELTSNCFLFLWLSELLNRSHQYSGSL